MAGVIDLVQRCYLGIEMRANVLHFDPALPAGLGRVKVRLRYRRQILDVEVDHDLPRGSHERVNSHKALQEREPSIEELGRLVQRRLHYEDA